MSTVGFPEFTAPLAPCNVPVRRCPVPRDGASRRFLIVRLGSHGDILMGTPLLAALRRAYPDAHLTWMVEHTEREAIDANPLVDEVIVWNGGYWKRMLRKGQYPLWLWRALDFRRALRRRRFDAFVTFHAEQWPLLVPAVGAPVSVGVFETFPQFDRARPRYARLYTHAYRGEDLPEHRTDIHLLPLRALDAPPLADKGMTMGFTRDDARDVDGFLREQGVAGDTPVVVLAPMTTWESRCWPEERFAALADRLARERNRRIVLIGSARERAAIERVAAQMQTAPILAAGRFRFRPMAALLARASLVISGDTGPMHVAAAVGVPYLALFGPTPVPGRAPLAGRGLSLAHAVPCGPCDRPTCANAGGDYMRCMRLISVEEAFRAATALVREETVL